MTDSNQHLSDERLSAYLDGDLSSVEKEQVEQLLASDAEARRLVDELKTLREAVRSLPQQTLGDDFTERVVLAATEAMEQAKQENSISCNNAPITLAKSHETEVEADPVWRRVAWPLMAAAAAIAIVFFYGQHVKDTEVARNDRAKSESTETGNTKSDIVANAEIEDERVERKPTEFAMKRRRLESNKMNSENRGTLAKRDERRATFDDHNESQGQAERAIAQEEYPVIYVSVSADDIESIKDLLPGNEAARLKLRKRFEGDRTEVAGGEASDKAVKRELNELVQQHLYVDTTPEIAAALTERLTRGKNDREGFEQNDLARQILRNEYIAQAKLATRKETLEMAQGNQFSMAPTRTAQPAMTRPREMKQPLNLRHGEAEDNFAGGGSPGNGIDTMHPAGQAVDSAEAIADLDDAEPTADGVPEDGLTEYDAKELGDTPRTVESAAVDHAIAESPNHGQTSGIGRSGSNQNGANDKSLNERALNDRALNRVDAAPFRPFHAEQEKMELADKPFPVKPVAPSAAPVAPTAAEPAASPEPAAPAEPKENTPNPGQLGIDHQAKSDVEIDSPSAELRLTEELKQKVTREPSQKALSAPDALHPKAEFDSFKKGDSATREAKDDSYSAGEEGEESIAKGGFSAEGLNTLAEEKKDAGADDLVTHSSSKAEEDDFEKVTDELPTWKREAAKAPPKGKVRVIFVIER